MGTIRNVCLAWVAAISVLINQAGAQRCLICGPNEKGGSCQPNKAMNIPASSKLTIDKDICNKIEKTEYHKKDLCANNPHGYYFKCQSASGSEFTCRSSCGPSLDEIGKGPQFDLLAGNNLLLGKNNNKNNLFNFDNFRNGNAADFSNFDTNLFGSNNNYGNGQQQSSNSGSGSTGSYSSSSSSASKGSSTNSVNQGKQGQNTGSLIDGNLFSSAGLNNNAFTNKRIQNNGANNFRQNNANNNYGNRNSHNNNFRNQNSQSNQYGQQNSRNRNLGQGNSKQNNVGNQAPSNHGFGNPNAGFGNQNAGFVQNTDRNGYSNSNSGGNNFGVSNNPKSQQTGGTFENYGNGFGDPFPDPFGSSRNTFFDSAPNSNNFISLSPLSQGNNYNSNTGNGFFNSNSLLRGHHGGDDANEVGIPTESKHDAIAENNDSSKEVVAESRNVDDLQPLNPPATVDESTAGISNSFKSDDSKPEPFIPPSNNNNRGQNDFDTNNNAETGDPLIASQPIPQPKITNSRDREEYPSYPNGDFRSNPQTSEPADNPPSLPYPPLTQDDPPPNEPVANQRDETNPHRLNQPSAPNGAFNYPALTDPSPDEAPKYDGNTEPSNYNTEPNNFNAEPNAYNTENNNFNTEPGNYNAGTNTYNIEPSNYNTDPKNYNTDPNNYNTDPNNYRPEPNNYDKKAQQKPPPNNPTSNPSDYYQGNPSESKENSNYAPEPGYISNPYGQNSNEQRGNSDNGLKKKEKPQLIDNSYRNNNNYRENFDDRNSYENPYDYKPGGNFETTDNNQGSNQYNSRPTASPGKTGVRNEDPGGLGGAPGSGLQSSKVPDPHGVVGSTFSDPNAQYKGPALAPQASQKDGKKVPDEFEKPFEASENIFPGFENFANGGNSELGTKDSVFKLFDDKREPSGPGNFNFNNPNFLKSDTDKTREKSGNQGKEDAPNNKNANNPSIGAQRRPEFGGGYPPYYQGPPSNYDPRGRSYPPPGPGYRGPPHYGNGNQGYSPNDPRQVPHGGYYGNNPHQGQRPQNQGYPAGPGGRDNKPPGGLFSPGTYSGPNYKPFYVKPGEEYGRDAQPPPGSRPYNPNQGSLNSPGERNQFNYGNPSPNSFSYNPDQRDPNSGPHRIPGQGQQDPYKQPNQYNPGKDSEQLSPFDFPPRESSPKYDQREPNTYSNPTRGNNPRDQNSNYHDKPSLDGLPNLGDNTGYFGLDSQNSKPNQNANPYPGGNNGPPSNPNQYDSNPYSQNSNPYSSNRAQYPYENNPYSGRPDPQSAKSNPYSSIFGGEEQGRQPQNNGNSQKFQFGEAFGILGPYGNNRNPGSKPQNNRNSFNPSNRGNSFGGGFDPNGPFASGSNQQNPQNRGRNPNQPNQQTPFGSGNLGIFNGPPQSGGQGQNQESPGSNRYGPNNAALQGNNGSPQKFGGFGGLGFQPDNQRQGNRNPQAFGNGFTPNPSGLPTFGSYGNFPDGSSKAGNGQSQRPFYGDNGRNVPGYGQPRSEPRFGGPGGGQNQFPRNGPSGNQMPNPQNGPNPSYGIIGQPGSSNNGNGGDIFQTSFKPFKGGLGSPPGNQRTPNGLNPLGGGRPNSGYGGYTPGNAPGGYPGGSGRGTNPNGFGAPTNNLAGGNNGFGNIQGGPTPARGGNFGAPQRGPGPASGGSFGAPQGGPPSQRGNFGAPQGGGFGGPQRGPGLSQTGNFGGPQGAPGAAPDGNFGSRPTGDFARPRGQAPTALDFGGKGNPSGGGPLFGNGPGGPGGDRPQGGNFGNGGLNGPSGTDRPGGISGPDQPSAQTGGFGQQNGLGFGPDSGQGQGDLGAGQGGENGESDNGGPASGRSKYTPDALVNASPFTFDNPYNTPNVGPGGGIGGIAGFGGSPGGPSNQPRVNGFGRPQRGPIAGGPPQQGGPGAPNRGGQPGLGGFGSTGGPGGSGIGSGQGGFGNVGGFGDSSNPGFGAQNPGNSASFGGQGNPSSSRGFGAPSNGNSPGRGAPNGGGGISGLGGPVFGSQPSQGNRNSQAGSRGLGYLKNNHSPYEPLSIERPTDGVYEGFSGKVAPSRYSFGDTDPRFDKKEPGGAFQGGFSDDRFTSDPSHSELDGSHFNNLDADESQSQKKTSSTSGDKIDQ